MACLAGGVVRQEMRNVNLIWNMGIASSLSIKKDGHPLERAAVYLCSPGAPFFDLAARETGVVERHVDRGRHVDSFNNLTLSGRRHDSIIHQ